MSSLVYGQSGTGDKELDSQLVSLDTEAKVSFSSFKVELSNTYAIPAPKIDYLKVEIGMSGGDIYMALEIARIKNISVDIVVNSYKKHKGQGWGVIAKDLGIKPGSAEFHQLKGNAKVKGKSGSKGNGNPSKGKKKGL